MAYAENTAVPVEKSKGEIEKLLHQHQCQKFMVGVDNEAHKATVQFQAHNRIIRFVLQLPDPRDPAHKKMKNSYLQRTQSGVLKLVEQLTRSRWRALLLVIKAKLEAVESGIATFEEEFMAQIVLPNDTTVGSWVLPEVAKIYESGRMPTNRQIESGEVVNAERVEGQ
jgi:hypothetical protein